MLAEGSSLNIGENDRLLVSFFLREIRPKSRYIVM